MTNIKILEQTGHQGDTEWFKVNTIPSAAILTEKKFIAASERSDSVHALSGKYDMYDIDGGFAIDCKEDCILNHTFASNIKNLDKAEHLPVKDHPASIIEKGVYLVGIQNRFDPLAGQKVKVTD